jgi:hypothetical protein
MFRFDHVEHQKVSLYVRYIDKIEFRFIEDTSA